jgi:hypothetical protein
MQAGDRTKLAFDPLAIFITELHHVHTPWESCDNDASCTRYSP